MQSSAKKASNAKESTGTNIIFVGKVSHAYNYHPDKIASPTNFPFPGSTAAVEKTSKASAAPGSLPEPSPVSTGSAVFTNRAHWAFTEVVPMVPDWTDAGLPKLVEENVNRTVPHWTMSATILNHVLIDT